MTTNNKTYTFTQAFFALEKDPKLRLTSDDFREGQHLASVLGTIYFFDGYCAIGRPASPDDFGRFAKMKFKELPPYNPKINDSPKELSKHEKAVAWMTDFLGQDKPLETPQVIDRWF